MELVKRLRIAAVISNISMKQAANEALIIYSGKWGGQV